MLFNQHGERRFFLVDALFDVRNQLHWWRRLDWPKIGVITVDSTLCWDLRCVQDDPHLRFFLKMLILDAKKSLDDYVWFISFVIIEWFWICFEGDFFNLFLLFYGKLCGNGQWKTCACKSAMKIILVGSGWLFDIEDFTAQLYGDYS